MRSFWNHCQETRRQNKRMQQKRQRATLFPLLPLANSDSKLDGGVTVFPEIKKMISLAGVVLGLNDK